jgi:hypothetical protein
MSKKYDSNGMAKYSPWFNKHARRLVSIQRQAIRGLEEQSHVDDHALSCLSSETLERASKSATAFRKTVKLCNAALEQGDYSPEVLLPVFGKIKAMHG